MIVILYNENNMEENELIVAYWNIMRENELVVAY